MPDLKITHEMALTALGRAADDAQARLRGTAEGLADELRQAHEALTTPMKLDVTAADAAVVIDFFNQMDNPRQLSLTLMGGYGGHSELHAALPRGRYRAMILITRLPEALDTSR